MCNNAPHIYLSSPHAISPNERKYLLDAFDSNWIAPLGPHHMPTFLKSLLERIEQSPVAKRIVSGAFWLVLGNGLARGLGFISLVLVARILGPKTFGEFGLIKSTALTFVTFSSFGMGLTATKYIAELLPSDKERVGRIIGLNYLFTFFSSSVVAMAFWIAAPWLCDSVLQSPHLVGLMRLGAVLLFLTTFYTTQQGVLAGFQDFRGLAFATILGNATMMPVYVAGAYYWGLTGVVVGAVTAAGLHAFINSVFIYRNTKHHAIRYRFSQAGRELGVLGWFSLPAVLSAIMYSVSFWGCQMMLGAQQDGAAQLGVFYAANVIFSIIVTIPAMFSPVYVATLSEMFGQADMKRFRKTVLLSFMVNVSIVTILALPFLCFPSLMMEWCFGESFREGGGTLVLLSLTAILYIVGNVVDQVMAGMGRIWFAFGYCLAGAATTLIVYLVVAAWGSFGLAFALLSGFCTRFILFVPIFFYINIENSKAAWQYR